MRVLFLLVLFVTGLLPLYAQPEPQGLPQTAVRVPTYRLDALTTAEGLSNNSVVTITQDHQGFMWFGTWSGLNRYDGSTFKTFYNNPVDSTSLPDNWVETTFVDGRGALWVGTYAGGLARFDPATESFKRFSFGGLPDDPTSSEQNLITTIVEDRDGKLWVGTHAGLVHLDPQNGDFTWFKNDPDDATSLSNDQVRALYLDRSGTLWVGTGSATPSETPAGLGGLNRYDPSTGTFTRYVHDPLDRTSLYDSKVRSIFEDSQGTLWVGTVGSVLHRMDRAAGTFERLWFDPATPDRLVPPPQASLPVACASSRCSPITFIREDASGLLWIGGDAFGALLYDATRNRVVRRYWDQTDDAALRLNSNGAFSFHTSSDGTVWIGNVATGGVHRLVPMAEHFVHFSPLSDDPNSLSNLEVNAVTVTQDGMVWFGTDGGLNRYDPSTGLFTHYLADPNDPNSLHSPVVVSLAEGRQGVLWIGTNDGLSRFDRATERFTRIWNDPTDPCGMAYDRISWLRADASGTLWIGNDRGLSSFAPSTECFTAYRHDPNDPAGLSHDGVSSLYIDSNDDLWIGTFPRGLDRMVRDAGTGAVSFEHYPPEVWLYTIQEDRKGRLWLGSLLSGLFLLDRGTGAVTRFSREEGRFEGEVVSMVEDDRGDLWYSTANQLVRFDPDARAFFTFEGGDGLPNIAFENKSAARGLDGTLYFGGRGGVVAFDPAPPTEDVAPTTTLTELRLFNDPVVPGPDALLQQPLFQTDRIDLTYTQNDFTISYQGLDYRRPGRIRYQYTLEGQDVGWVDAGTQHSARYTRLPPGDYVFHVRAASRYGAWNEQPTSLRVTITPPWWRTWWAFLLYGLAFVGSVFAVDRFQRRRLIRRERERARERELEQAKEIERAYHELRETKDRLVQQEKLASLGQLTAGVAHEIKNPLNFINNFAEVNEELADELDEAVDAGEAPASLKAIIADLRKNAQVIAQHGKRADGIVHAMMQHASGGVGRHEATDINQLVEEHIDLAYHGKRAQLPDLEVEVRRDPGKDVGNIEVVPQEIGRVLLNLLGNAFDAVHERAATENGDYAPTVTVSTRRIDGQVEIRVSDNGAGVPSSVRDHIFEPFFTTKPTGSGTGLGLSLSYDIVTQGHGGTLTVESEEGEGATFIVTLPPGQRGLIA